LFNGNDSEVSRTSSALAARTSDLSPAAYTGIETKIQPLLLIYIKVKKIRNVDSLFGVGATCIVHHHRLAYLLQSVQLALSRLFFCFLLDCLIVFLSLLIGMISVKTSQ